MPIIFDVTATATFNDTAGGAYQRIFDFSNGAGQDNIWLGNVGLSDTMAFEVQNANGHFRFVVPNAIVDGEEATWRATIHDDGTYEMFKNGVSVASHNFGVAALPADVPRTDYHIGDSPYSADAPLDGAVSALSVTSTLTHFDDVNFSDGSVALGSSADDNWNLVGLSTSTRVDTAAGNDTLVGGSGDDILSGGAGNDQIDGGAGNDELYGNEGNDTLAGGEGNDLVDGFIGDDNLAGGAGNDTLRGGDGADTLDGGDGADMLFGDSGADFLDGGAGNDLLDGHAGNDTLLGGAGDDQIDGGAGNDTLTGGDGNDTFVYDGQGADTISDFNFGNSGAIGDNDTTNNDVIDLSAYYDTVSEVRADFDDDGVLNHSNSATVDYSNNSTLDGSNNLTFLGANSNSFTADNTAVTCFARGASILTPAGYRRVEDLRCGDLVETFDDGPQEILWMSKSVFESKEDITDPKLQPIRIKPGVLSNTRAVVVSPQHGVAVQMPGHASAVFVRARHLAEETGLATKVQRRKIVYFHLLLAKHSLLISDGLVSESFYPGKFALAALDSKAKKNLFAAFPDLETGRVEDVYGMTRLPFIKRSAVRGRLAQDFQPPLAVGAAPATINNMTPQRGLATSEGIMPRALNTTTYPIGNAQFPVRQCKVSCAQSIL